MAESIPEKDQFLIAYPNYVLRETVTYPNGGVSRFYDDGVDMVIIDDEICSCRNGEQIFPYTLITDKQNHYMKIYQRVFRFLGFDAETIEKCLQKGRQEVLYFTKKISERGEHADSSPLELLFEQNFTDVYGMRALKYLQKEFRISDEDGNNYFLDYLVDTADSRVAIEENGIHYHHPQLIGIEGYRKQLRKQNTCALWGLKLYRFSTEDCRFKDRIEDDIRSYLGKDTGGFREAGLLLERKTELYEHQEISLAQIHMHNYREEVWTVVSGKGKAIVDGMEQVLRTGDVITIAAGCRHTVEAITPLDMIEVQLGDEISVTDKIKFPMK